MKGLISNILKGAGSIFSIIPHNELRSAQHKRYQPHKSDSAALSSDWKAIGKDFNKALNQVVHDER